MNPKKETKEERFNRYKKIILEIILKKMPKCKVYLFGSRARADFKEGSDIDLAIDTKKKIDLKTIIDIYSEIEATTIPLKVDIVDLNNIDDDFKKQINKEKILWRS